MVNSKIDLAFAERVIQAEGQAVLGLLQLVRQDAFSRVVQLFLECEGAVIVSGMGKAGIIGNKISATLASTGTASHFLHPAEAVHGDLGRIQTNDVVLALSHSGESEEIVRLIEPLKQREIKLVSIVGDPQSRLAVHSDVVLCMGMLTEACPLGVAPSVSTTCMLALGDALALTVMDMRKFSPEEFAAFHPAGALGRSLLKVEEAMTFRLGERLPVADDRLTVREVLSQAETIPRRAGAVLLVDDEGRLSGILTDADLRRKLLADSGGRLLDRPVAEVMHPRPKAIRAGELASKALAVMNRYRIDELPVVDDAGRPVGLLDVQDLVGLKAFEDERD